MMIRVTAGRALGGHGDFDDLFRDWLDGSAFPGSAADEWREFLTGGRPPDGPSPAFADGTWAAARLRALQEDLPDDEARDRAAENWRALTDGRAEVIVTGQQPGFLGGPLYTLYKIATAIVAAEARTQAGRPTLPLFWSGDDDDDRREAFAPRLFDPDRGVLLSPRLPAGAADRMVGAAPAAEWATGGASWLAEQASRGRLAADLSRLWRRGVAENLPWGRLQTRGLTRLFAGTDLLVVSGDDSPLHQLAEPFYRRYWRLRDELITGIAQSGQMLIEMEYHAQIGEGSRRRILNLARDGRRLALPADTSELPPAGQLRPGVAVRSPVQDWLFRPAGVVVGPGELAYLKQLGGVYDRLELPRSPLVPRLFATLAPPAAKAVLLVDNAAADPADRADRPDSLYDEAREITDGWRSFMEADLIRRNRLGKRTRRVVEQALGESRRGLEREFRKRGRAEDELDAVAEAVPWLRPRGKRQERSLAALWAAALWGDGLASAVLEAARGHLAAGAGGDWREMLLLMPEPKQRD